MHRHGTHRQRAGAATRTRHCAIRAASRLSHRSRGVCFRYRSSSRFCTFCSSSSREIESLQKARIQKTIPSRHRCRTTSFNSKRVLLRRSCGVQHLDAADALHVHVCVRLRRESHKLKTHVSLYTRYSCGHAQQNTSTQRAEPRPDARAAAYRRRPSTPYTRTRLNATVSSDAAYEAYPCCGRA